MKFKEKDTATVKSRHNGHGFAIGEQVTIIQVCERDNDYKCRNEAKCGG